MSQTDSELVKSKVDIIDIIGSRVEIKRAGKHFKGPCPFHAENDPSFIVSPELQIYKCFGCGKSGDVYTFLQEYEGMDFIESLEYLAEKVNVTLTRKVDSGGQKKQLIEIHKSVNNFYKYILLSHVLGKEARDYLSKRGISQKTIQEFEIGYSPVDHEPYRKYMMDKKKYKIDLLERAGLAYGYYGRPKDRFSGRVTFPLFDHRGVILGFAGRILPAIDNGKTGKYINSPETDIYHKSRMLYGLFQAKEYIRKKNVAILVEGELDMISSYQAGVKNTVAIKGSALTNEQTILLKRFTDRVILALDADFAGNAAAMRGIQIAEQSGLEVKVAVLGKYKDPDEAIKSNLSDYKDILKNSKSVWDFLIDSTFERHDPKTGSGKQKISREIIPVLSSINDSIVRSYYTRLVAKRLEVDPQSVAEQLGKSTDNVSSAKKQTEKSPKKDRRLLLEERFLSLSFQFEPSMVNVKSSKLVKDRKLSLIVGEYTKFSKEEKDVDMKEFIKVIPSHLVETFESLMLNEAQESSDDIEKEIQLVLRELEKLDLNEKEANIQKEIVVSESKGDRTLVRKLQRQHAKLIKRQAKLAN